MVCTQTLKMDINVCRICLNKTASIGLFSKQGDIELSTMIMRCVNVIIVKGDGFPELICTKCAGELLVTYEFVDKCEASDKALRCVDLSALSNDETTIPIKEEDIKMEPPQDDDNWDDNISLHIPETDPVEKKKRKYVKRSPLDGRKLRPKAGPIQCVVCGLLTSCRSMMEAHMRVHTGEKPFQCHNCDASFKAKGSLKRHIEVRHSVRERKYICEMCGSSFYRKNDIVIHMRVHTDEKPCECPFCFRRFRQISSLIRHKRVHTGERPYSCHHCKKTFADKNQMKKHLVVHTDEKKFSCHLCSRSVKTRNALTTHMKIHSDEKQNICSYCGMAFRLKGNLKLHMTRVHSERSGECNECQKTFSDIQAHMRKHTGEKPFVCKICNQGFAVQRSLTHHITFRHQNAAKYQCAIGECTKTFPMAAMLEFHLLKQHTNHTPFVCHHCSKGFYRTSDLNRHLRGSHMEVPVKAQTKAIMAK